MKSHVLHAVCDVIFLVRLQEKIEIDHFGSKRVNN